MKRAWLLGFSIVFFGCINICLWLILLDKFDTTIASLAGIFSGILMIAAYLYAEKRFTKKYKAGSMALALSASGTAVIMALLSWIIISQTKLTWSLFKGLGYVIYWFGFVFFCILMILVSLGLAIYRHFRAKKAAATQED